MKDDILKTIQKKRNSIEFELWGNYALFSDPVTRIGGEKFSYQFPTYQALKGILESIYWKPTLIWYVDAVRIVNKIQTEGKGIRPIKMSGGNDLSYYTYLKKVKYQVLAHFEWNLNRENLKQDRNENKHHNIAKRMLEKGGSKDIFLGTRECQGYVAPCEFGAGNGYYDDYGTLNFGFSFHGIDYPDEVEDGILSVRFWDYKMQDGIIIFPSLNSGEIKRRKMENKQSVKKFEIGINLKAADDEEVE